MQQSSSSGYNRNCRSIDKLTTCQPFLQK